MTAGLTWVTRKRRRAGKLAAAHGAPLGLPMNLFVRGLLFGVAATLILGGIGLALLAAIWTPALPFAVLLAFKTGYGAVVGLVATPIIIVAALRGPLPVQSCRE